MFIKLWFYDDFWLVGMLLSGAAFKWHAKLKKSTQHKIFGSNWTLSAFLIDVANTI